MKHYLHTRPAARHLLCLALTASLALLPLPSLAASVALATAPLVTATTSTVRPNLLFILDDSGSMDWDYLPDWANDNHPTTGTNYTSMPELFKNNGFNGVAYNPAVTYSPPVLYNANGTLNTTTYPGQTGLTTATGADSTAKPNWKTVKNDAYGIQSTSTSNLTSASYYVFVPGEYCSATDLKTCVAATAPSASYPYAAGVRWCNSAVLTTCRSINDATYKYPRHAGKPATATITVTAPGGATSTTVSSIKVNGKEILPATTAGSATAGTVATNIKNGINACTAAISGICTIAGYSATVSGSVVTVTAPVGTGVTTYLPTVTRATGNLTVTPAAFSGGIPGSNILTNIVSTTDSYPYPGTTTKASTRTDCTTDTTDPKTCTYAEEMTNYANWWTYYHTRMQAMKTSVSRAFSTLDNRYRVGFTTISDHTAVNGTKFLGNDTFELVHKNNWYTKLFATDTPSRTPLRGALSKAGRYYAKKVQGQTVDPVQYSCQQNFTILSTDGYWNTGDENPANPSGDVCTTNTAGSTNYGAYGFDKQTCVGNLDGGTTPRPMKEGTTAVPNTLADIAKYYYDNDLRTGTPGVTVTGTLNNCAGGISTDFPAGNPDVCSEKVLGSPDNYVTQRMTTFTMGLGADGTLDFTTDYKTATSGDYYNLKNGLGSPTVNWPNPIANSAGERIDDLWHAAVNGQGTYFSAKNPDEIIAGFNQALSSMTAKLGAAAAAATSTLNPVAGNNFAYVASYTTVKWQGNLESRNINVNTGVVSETATWCVESIVSGTCSAPSSVVADTSGTSTIYNCVTPSATSATCPAPGVLVGTDCKVEIPLACTGTMGAKVGAISDTRTIYTANSAGTALIAFNAAYATANPTNFAAAHINTLSQWGSLNPAQQTAAAGINLLNFLRGQNGFEDRAANAATDRLYRAREAVLGDALESQPAFLSKPVFNYADPGYSAFAAAHAGRAGSVYMGTNDGMLHAFAADTGIERWAYVPSMVIPNMWKLADKNYATLHTNFVNGSPVMSDVCTANCTNSATAVWRTILVGGLNAGGRGYYALDITDPVTPTLLWEFTPAQNANLGYSYGHPVITKKADGTWVVLVTSGYNNTSPGDGKGYLYVLNALTGAIISAITTNVGDTTTPSGLAAIAGWNSVPASNQVSYVYGGDLLGNVWRFDINSAVTAAATASPLGLVQQFGALGGSGVTGAAGTGVIVSGDVGSSPTATITNFGPSSVAPGFVLRTTNDAVVQQARLDATAAANNLASQGPGTVLAAQLNGQVLTSGSYSFASTADLAASGTLTLNGPGVFVFNVGSTLTANVGSIVVGTADPCNVFWRVGTSATLNGNSFFGTVIAATGSVTVGGGANVTGRVVAATAVTMAGTGGNTIGGCSLQSAAIGTGDVMKFATLFSDAAGTQPQPITTPPVLGNIGGKRVIFVGTGKYLETSDLTNTQPQSEYAIKDDDATATLVNPRASTTTPKMVQQTITTSGGTRTVSNNPVDFNIDRGWYVDFPDSGERVNIDGKLVLGTLLVPTIVPSNTVCSPGGYGWLNFFNYEKGGAIDTTTNLASVKYDAPIVGINILYILGKPIVEVVTSTKPTPEKEERIIIKPPTSGFSGKRVLWRELIP